MQGHNHLPNTALVSILKHILYITSRMLHDRPHKSHEDASPPAPETMSDAEVNARLIFPDPIKIQCTESKAPMPKKYSSLISTPRPQNSEVDMRPSTFVKSSIRELLSPLFSQYFKRHFDLSICHVSTAVTFQQQGIGAIRLHQSKFTENNRITYICARCQELNRCCIVGEGESSTLSLTISHVIVILQPSPQNTLAHYQLGRIS